MDIIRGDYNFKPHQRGCVATIGNFDGLHLGHQTLIQRVAERATALNLPATVISFEPLPREYFLQDQAPPRLSRLREKIHVLQQLPVERYVCLNFNQRLAAMSAEEFVQQILIDGLGVKHLLVGDDFRFGKQRLGDFALLEKFAEQGAFSVENAETITQKGERVSSTRVRQALATGDMQAAEQLLRRPYTISGRVFHGDKRGRTIGFPTANMHLLRNISPITGVFAVNVCADEGLQAYGIANLGKRPTVDGTRIQLETHLLDFSGDLYGQHLEIAFLHKIRDEMRFNGLDELIAQIKHDREQAVAFFANR